MDNYDYIRTETELGELRHKATADWLPRRIGSEIERVEEIYAKNVNAKSVHTELARIDQVAGGVRATSDTTVPSGSLTTVDLDSVLFEDDQIVSIDTANSEIAIVEPGKYLVIGSIQYANDTGWTTGDDAYPQIQRNGSFEGRLKVNKVGTSDEDRMVVEIIDANQGDVLTLATQQNSGTDQVINGNPPTNLTLGRL